MARDNAIAKFLQEGGDLASQEGVGLICDEGIRAVRCAIKDDGIRAALLQARDRTSHIGFQKTLTLALRNSEF